MLLSAALHAGWNGLVAGARDTYATTAVMLVTGAVALAPFAAATWRVDAAALPWAGASTALELAYFGLLARAYAAADLTTVYPVARGAAPVIALVASVVLFAATALLYVPVVAGRSVLHAAVGWRSLLAGVGMTAAYVLVLLALERAEAAPVAALRETGVVMATAAAAIAGRRHVPPARVVGAGVVVAGVAAIAPG